MNELLNYLNNYAKNRKNKQRFSAIMVCLAVIVSFTVSVGLIEPAESASGELICGMEEHEHTQNCFELICGFDEETEEEIVVETTLSDSEETTESTTSTEKTTTADTEPATTDAETTDTIISTCTDESVPVSVHIHNDECYRLICLTEAHLHKQDCYNQPVETEPAATETSTSASTSTSTETDTTATTEQTAETTTTTTELSEEAYELNAALFGELYKDRVNILADAQKITKDEVTYTYYEIEDVKFYYENGELYVNECFGYRIDGDTVGDNAHHPAANGSFNISGTYPYNGVKYVGAYNFDYHRNAGRYISFKAPEDKDGTLIFLFNNINEGQSFTIKVTENISDTNLAGTYSFTKVIESKNNGLMSIAVKKDTTYKIEEIAQKNEGKARLIYAEFVPVSEAGKVYRIIDVETGKYVELSGDNIELGGETPSGDLSNDFKLTDAGDGSFNIYPQSIENKVIDYEVNNNNIHIYNSNDGNNQKFQFILNDDGTYKIKSPGYDNSYWKVDGNNDIKTDSSAEASNFRIVEATEIVYPKADLDTDNPYLLRNVRSRQFVHKEAKVEIKDANGNVTQTLYNQIIQQKDIGTDSQFKFFSTGTAGEYYIVSADGNYALTTGQNITNGADVDYSGFNNSDNQKFYAEKMDDDSVRFYQINNGVKYYLGVKDKSINSGVQFELKEADRVNDYQCFFIVPVVAPEEVLEANTRVEARVVFADYNEGKDDGTDRYLYDEVEWTPTIELYKGNESAPIHTEKANLVIDVSEARKDWCYQYNYVWDLEEDTTNEYTVKLNGVNSENKITLNGKAFNVYYLKDTELNHPGNDGNSNAPAEAYKKTPYSQTGDQIIYIFLDPEVEKWWGSTTAPRTIDLSMKKRWDGHNSAGFDNRKKEKIQIQLQKLVTVDGVEKWVEYNPTVLNDDYRSIIYYEKNNKSNNFVNETFEYNGVPLVSADVPEDQRLTRVVPGVEEEVAWQTPDGKYVNKTVLEQAQGAKDGATVAKADRLELVLHYNEWNNVILSYDKGNKPSHFQQGYYMNWTALPYGNYRVVETMSFYDANDNDVFDEGDRDTSNEYYYMSYPPMRDSKGVLHIQNFTKDMVLDIHKEWYDNTGTEKMDNPGKTVKVNIYRSLEKLSDPSVAKLGVPIYSDVEVTGDNVILKTTAGYDKLLLKTTSEQKYYYYIQEVSVDGYLLLDGNNEGFVKSTNGKYYVDYEDGDGRKFILKNKADFSLNIEKKWYQGDEELSYSKIENPIRPEFEIYKADVLGTPVVSTANNTISCAVEYTYMTAANTKATIEITKTEVPLELIGEAKVDELGNLKIIYNNNTTTTSVDTFKISELDMSEIVEEVTPQTGFLNKKLIRDNDDNVVIDNNYITIKKGGIFWAGTKNNDKRKGTLTIEVYEEDRGKDIYIWFCDKGIHNDDIYKPCVKDNNGIIKFSNLNLGGNYRIRASEEIKLSKITFTLDNYYYIREKSSDSYTLINGDANGFVKNEDGTYYTQITASNNHPIITAKNNVDVEMDITKEWTQSNAEISKVMNFEIYKAFANGEPVVNGEGYKVTVNDVDYQLTKLSGEYKTDENGNLNVADLPAFEKGSDEKYHKLYYYVRETDGNYTITNTNAKNGFIPYESGQYGTAFDDTSSNSGKYKFTNTPKLDITVNKKWFDEKDNEDINKAKTEIKFELYRKIENGTPELIKDGENNFFITESHAKLIQNLDAYDENGNIYTYYIKEIDGETYYISGFNVKYNNQTNPEKCAFSWKKDGEKPVINITNQAKPQNYELPETGGSGTHGCTAAGGTIVLISATVLLLKRRKKMV